MILKNKLLKILMPIVATSTLVVPIAISSCGTNGGSDYDYKTVEVDVEEFGTGYRSADYSINKNYSYTYKFKTFAAHKYGIFATGMNSLGTCYFASCSISYGTATLNKLKDNVEITFPDDVKEGTDVTLRVSYRDSYSNAWSIMSFIV